VTKNGCCNLANRCFFSTQSISSQPPSSSGFLWLIRAKVSADIYSAVVDIPPFDLDTMPPTVFYAGAIFTAFVDLLDPFGSKPWPANLLLPMLLSACGKVIFFCNRKPHCKPHF